MGLAAFVFFVVPWMLVGYWMFRSSNAVRMGLPATPWRPLTDFPPPPRDQRDAVDTGPVPEGASSDTADAKHRPLEIA